MHLVIFEASRWDTFAPLTLNRPAFTLLCGASTLVEKHIRWLRPTRLTLWVRPELVEFCTQFVLPKLKVPTKVNEPLDDEPALIVAGRSVYLSKPDIPDQECVVTDPDNLIIKAFVKRPGLSHDDAIARNDKWMSLFDLPRSSPEGRLPGYVWDLVNWNEEALVSDSIGMTPSSDIPAGPYYVVNQDNLFLGTDVQLSPGVVLNAGQGPIMIARGVSIGANSVIEGPCYIGEFSIIAPLTHIGPGTTLGPGCRIGGGVANSIVMGFTDKPYEGYLGDSYVGRWVTLGAGTTTANIKATMSAVDVKIGSRKIETGRRTMGSIIGDHTRTAINTRFSPGCYVGYFSMLVGAGLVPAFVPSFSFWTDQGIIPIDAEKGLEIARHSMDRRDRQWTELDDSVHRYAREAAKQVEK
jgi:UDP-N-acetylglucosamine diphosphorylase / glucose-1-phosphate thymidylyltransferase / UDP-N-acetylgalactosamine diphosphorylase / glucosamine-1-phosphate N-acetyltransferase / galactosamine-1-phosphate N-acetyltransferase